MHEQQGTTKGSDRVLGETTREFLAYAYYQLARSQEAVESARKLLRKHRQFDDEEAESPERTRPE